MPQPNSQPNTYTVKAGDNLSQIAQTHKVPMDKITGYASGNPDLIMPGEVLNIPQNQTVVSSGKANKEFYDYSAKLTTNLSMLDSQNQNQGEEAKITLDSASKTDPYSMLLNEISKTSSQATKALIASIQASKQSQANQTEYQYENYKKGLQLLGIQHNKAQATPDILMSHIQEAQNQKMKILSDLDREEKKAILDAEMAQQEKNLSVLKQKMDRVNELKKEKQNALKDLYDTLSTETAIADNRAEVIYDAVQKLNPKDKEQFLIEVSKKYSIPVMSLIASLNKIKEGKKKSSGVGKKLTLSQIEKFKSDYPELADQMKFGMTEAEVASIIENADEKSVEVQQSLTMSEKAYEKLEKVGINSSDVVQLQKMLNSGKTIEEIKDDTGMPNKIYNILLEYIN